MIGKNMHNINFKEFLNTFVKFTNCTYFKDHYNNAYKSLTQYPRDKECQFLSFISALNEVLFSRFAILETCNFYLQLPLRINDIKAQLIETRCNPDELEYCKYVDSFIKWNRIEQNSKENYLKKGYNITSVLKYSELNGLTASDDQEYSKNKQPEFVVESEITPILNNVSNSIISQIENIDFPKTPTIKTTYQSFEKILQSTYIIPIH